MNSKKDTQPLLDNLVIASPCSIPWESMTGDNRTRCCGGCSRTVFNVSDMTKGEAESFLAENGTTECMTFYRRFDGTILTDDCPVGLRALRDRCKMVLNMVAGVAAFLISIPVALAQGDKVKPISNYVEFGTHTRGSIPRAQAPPGYTYSPNPAGGGVILRPVDGMVTGGKPMMLNPQQQHLPVAPNVAHPTQPATTPTTTPSSHTTTAAPGVVKLHAQETVFMSTAALELYKKGQAAASQGHKTLAEFYFEKALDQFDLQKKGDAKFRQQIEKSLREVQSAK